ncbi:MAG: hypothetical protein FWF59_09655 [Turicibacter sp.]|nr:hypothetical protein [Turicibacter sp.]
MEVKAKMNDVPIMLETIERLVEEREGKKLEGSEFFKFHATDCSYFNAGLDFGLRQLAKVYYMVEVRSDPVEHLLKQMDEFFPEGEESEWLEGLSNDFYRQVAELSEKAFVDGYKQCLKLAKEENSHTYNLKQSD